MNKYARVKKEICGRKRDQILIEYLITVLIVLPPLIFLWYMIAKDKTTHCNIMVREWSAILLTIYLSWRTLSLCQICVLYGCYESKNISNTLFFLIGASLLFAWIVVGNVWLNSDSNNCKEVESTEPYWYLMMLLVVVGDLLILLYVVAVFIIPCIYINFRSQPSSKP